MKKLHSLLALLSLSTCALAQDFTWVNGNTSINVSATYGFMGAAAPGNDPGARHGCARWVDKSGNLWLFGGEGYGTGTTNNWLSDLWKYDIAIHQWIWIKGPNVVNMNGTYGNLGVASPANEPGAREFPASWTDAAGNFWMFGGRGFGSSPSQTTPNYLGDLWKYDPVTNQWTWMHGPNTITQNGIYGTQGTAAITNFPGTRWGAGTWSDANGNLWMFGGDGFPATGTQGYLNDLWKYNIASGQWTWVSGSNTTNQNGVYGTMGTPAPGNYPGGRHFSNGWADASNNVYLFGGEGMPISGIGRLNDIWKYNTATNQWTWVNGSSNWNPQAVYGTQNVPSAATSPGGRLAAASWTDPFGNFWIFAGEGHVASPIKGYLDDLFKYDPAANMWTWVKGSTALNQNGTYGTMGVAASSNLPGARTYNTAWNTGDGKLWLYGGEGYDANSQFSGNLSDLWYFKVPCNPDSITIAPGRVLCAGIMSTLTAVNGGPSTLWYPTETSTTFMSGGSTLTLPGLTATAQTTYSFYAVANSCTTAPRTMITITVNPKPNLVLTALTPTICKGGSATLTASGAKDHYWMTISSTISTTIHVVTNAVATVSFPVVGVDVNGCRDTAMVVQYVDACLGIEKNTKTHYSLFPNPNTGVFTLASENFPKGTQLIIYNALGQTVFEEAVNADKTLIRSNLSPGIYYYRIFDGSVTEQEGKILVE